MASFSNLWLAPIAPLLFRQGDSVRRNMPRLSEAQGPCKGRVPGDEPAINIVAVGESPIAGVGVSHMDKSLAARLAHEINQHTGRAVTWKAFGKNGATVADNDDLVRRIEESRDELQNADLMLLVMGMSDALSFTSPRRFSRKIDCLVLRLRMRLWPLPVLLAGVPQPERFAVRLPNPLRWALAHRARSLDAALVKLSEQSFQVRHCPSILPVDAGTNPDTARAFASDGFHPGAEGYRLWAMHLLPYALEMLEVSKRRNGDHRNRSALGS